MQEYLILLYVLLYIITITKINYCYLKYIKDRENNKINKIIKEYMIVETNVPV